MGKLALVRHGESVWNSKNLWTGWVDEPLTQKGRQEAEKSAEKLHGATWDIIFESDLTRVKETTEILIKSLGLTVPVIETATLRERNYGIYTGRNKFEVEKELGDEKFKHLRRGWDYPIPEGESLKQVYERVVPYYLREIEPRLTSGLNIVISASNNSLRALYKYLKNLSDEEIENFEIETGEVVIISFPAP